MYSLHLRICNLSMASLSIAQRSHLITSAQLDTLCPELLHLQMPPSTTPTQRLSNNALNLLLSDVLYFAYFDGCRVFDLVMMLRDLERR